VGVEVVEAVKLTVKLELGVDEIVGV